MINEIQVYINTHADVLSRTRGLNLGSSLPKCGFGEGTGAQHPPLKNHKNIWYSSNTGLDPLKNHCYQASIQCLAIIGTPSKRHFMAFCWRADDGPLLVVLGSSIPSSAKKKKIKRCQSWTPSDKTFWIRACFFFFHTLCFQKREAMVRLHK